MLFLDRAIGNTVAKALAVQNNYTPTLSNINKDQIKTELQVMRQNADILILALAFRGSELLPSPMAMNISLLQQNSQGIIPGNLFLDHISSEWYLQSMISRKIIIVIHQRLFQCLDQLGIQVEPIDCHY